MPVDRPPVPATLRARVTNRRGAVGDGRSAAERRRRDLTNGLLGSSNDVAELLAMRIAAALLMAEKIEAAAAAGQAVNLDRYAKLLSTIGRLLTKLDAERRRAKRAPLALPPMPTGSEMAADFAAAANDFAALDRGEPAEDLMMTPPKGFSF